MLRRRYNHRFADNQSDLDDSETDPSDYEGLTDSDFHEVATKTRTMNPRAKPRTINFNINNTNINEVARAENKKLLNDSLESSSESELSLSSDGNLFSDRQSEDKLVFRNANVPDLTQRKLKKRFKDLSKEGRQTKKTEVPKLNFRGNHQSNHEVNRLEVNHEHQGFRDPNSVIWVPYVPTDEYDQTQVFDASDPGDFSNMMQMFQSVFTDGRVLTREQIESFMPIDHLQQNERKFHEESLKRVGPKRTLSLNAKKYEPDESRRVKDKERKYSDQYAEKARKPSKGIRGSELNEISENEPTIMRTGKRSKTPTIDVAVNLNLGNGSLLLNNQQPQNFHPSINDHQNGVRDSLDLYKGIEEAQRYEPLHSNRDNMGQATSPTKPKVLRKIKRVSSNPRMLAGPPKELPRSLGPDWVEVEKKAQSLNRRSLYSQFVSVKNSRLPAINRAPEKRHHLSKREIAEEYAKGASVYVQR